MTVLEKKIVKKKQRLISIDPSINNLGMCIWDLHTGSILLYKLVHPIIGMRENEFNKSKSMLDQLKQWIQTYGVNRMIMEVPEHWAVGGFQARETGSMTKLSLVVGFIYSLVYDLEQVQLVTPAGWKGQLSKEVMVNRLYDEYIQKGIDLRKMDSNVADSIGIGHYFINGSV